MNVEGFLLEHLGLLTALSVALLYVLASFKGSWPEIKKGNPAYLTLGLILFLYGAIINLEQRVDHLQDHMPNVVGTRVVQGDNVYFAATEAVAMANDRIRTVIVSSGPKAPPSFAEAVARRMKERAENGQELRFEAVLVLDSQKGIDLNAVEKSNKERLAIYDRRGVRDHIDVRVLDDPTAAVAGFDVLIVDRTLVHIGFPTSDSSKLNTSILFELPANSTPAQSLSTNLVEWFDKVVFP